MTVRDYLSYINSDVEKTHPLWVVPFPGPVPGSVKCGKGAKHWHAFVPLPFDYDPQTQASVISPP